MVNRGITDPVTARSFLSSDLSGLSDPRIFTDMEKAVRRIRDAVSAREKIVVYGDYDVDGVTAAAILFLALKDMGAAVECYIPDRMTEGYGLNSGAIRKLKASGAGLVVTVDCGIGALAEAELARELGLDLIITDHHEFSRSNGSNSLNAKTDAAETGPDLPRAYALLHPALVSPEFTAQVRNGLIDLTGAGVAFRLAQSLLSADLGEERMLPFLALATLGTVADVGRLTGENRILVKHGLAVLSSDGPALRPGIAALKRVAGLNDKKINAGNVGFSLAPRINASGRLESADMAFRLLVTESASEASELALALDAVNKERQSVEEGIWEEARRMSRKLDMHGTGAILLSSAEWHPGVVGIVASRIADEFYRPTALISVKDGVGKGSARSVPGFDLYHAFNECSDLLLGFGGHRYAAGFTVAEERISGLRERLNEVALKGVGEKGFVRTMHVDGAVELEDLTLDLMHEIEQLAPFGQGNPEPRLGARGLEVISSRIVGNNHLKLQLRQKNGNAFGAIAFNRGALLGRKVRDGARVAAVFTPRINTWNGKTAVELEIRDLKEEKG
jgi:single-stranded-DNA-specific exonuclease